MGFLIPILTGPMSFPKIPSDLNWHDEVEWLHRQGRCLRSLCTRLFAFLVVGHGRRRLLWFDDTRHPTAEWLARQMTEAFPWASTPAYLIRDNDRVYGQAFTTRVTAMGIRDRPISPGAPWQNGIAKSLIGTLRRECPDHVVIFGEAHLRRVLSPVVTLPRRWTGLLRGQSLTEDFGGGKVHMSQQARTHRACR